jgi:hypothetical protein
LNTVERLLDGKCKGRRSMYDTLMLALGLGLFALFLGYSELCVKL